MKARALQIRFSLRAQPTEVSHAPDTGRVPRITQALALAIHFEDLIRTSEATDYATVARMNGMSRERVSQVTRLNFLAPDIQVEILFLPPTPTGRYPISEVALRKIASLLSWAEQREQWARLKEAHRLA